MTTHFPLRDRFRELDLPLERRSLVWWLKAVLKPRMLGAIFVTTGLLTLGSGLYDRSSDGAALDTALIPSSEVHSDVSKALMPGDLQQTLGVFQTGDETAPASSTDSIAAALFDLQNAERLKAGRAELYRDDRLTEIATRRASDMATGGYFAHASPSGETSFSLLSESGYEYSIAAENLTRNNYPVEQAADVAMGGFLSSAPHYANLIDGRVSAVGIGIAVGAEGMTYFVIVFTGS